MTKIETLRMIGRKICHYRKLKKMSQHALAKEAHVGENYICRLEKGIQNTTIETLLDISRGLNVEIKNLFE